MYPRSMDLLGEGARFVASSAATATFVGKANRGADATKARGTRSRPLPEGCPACVAAQGRQRSHWRASVKSVYSASFDIAGPFVKG